MSLEEQLKTIKAEVDTLQIKMAEEQRPWYQKPANLFSLFAIALSLVTTLIAFKQTHDTQLRENRRDVRQMIQRLSRLPIENFEFRQKYMSTIPKAIQPSPPSKANFQSLNADANRKNQADAQAAVLSGMIAQEQRVLGDQAAEGINRYPNEFTATEYLAVAQALAHIKANHHVSAFLNKAIDLSTTITTYIRACRSHGHYFFTQGKSEEGREYYNKALEMTWEKFPTSDTNIIHWINAETYLYLANSELTQQNLEKAKLAIAKATQTIDNINNSYLQIDLRKQVSALEANIMRIQSRPPAYRHTRDPNREPQIPTPR